MVSDSDKLISKFYQILREKIIPILYKLPEDRTGGDTAKHSESQISHTLKADKTLQEN